MLLQLTAVLSQPVSSVFWTEEQVVVYLLKHWYGGFNGVLKMLVFYKKFKLESSTLFHFNLSDCNIMKYNKHIPYFKVTKEMWERMQI